MEPLVKPADAARLLGINVFTLYALVRARKLAAIRSGPSGRCYRFRPEDLEAYKMKNPTIQPESEREPLGAA